MDMRSENSTIPDSSSASRNHCPVAAARSDSLGAGFEADGFGAPQAVTARTAITRVEDRIRAVGRMANLLARYETVGDVGRRQPGWTGPGPPGLETTTEPRRAIGPRGSVGTG